MKNKTLEEMDFKELTEFATVRIHVALLEEGGKGMRAAVSLWLNQAIMWDRNLGDKDYYKNEKD